MKIYVNNFSTHLGICYQDCKSKERKKKGHKNIFEIGKFTNLKTKASIHV